MKYISFFLMILLFNIPFFMAQDISFDEYPSNPVFDPATRAYYPTVIFDINKFSGHGGSAYYKMWYNDGSGGIYLTKSDDGILWEAVTALNGLSSAYHPVVLYDANEFGGGGINYKIWYWVGGSLESINSIRYAESTDGVNWINDQPIQQHASDSSLQLVTNYSLYNHYFYHLYGPGYVIYNPAGTNVGSTTPDNKKDDEVFSYKYIMYYDSSSEGTSPNQTNEDTSLAYSANGIYWIRYGDKPVLISSGDPNDWDGKYSYRVSVVKIDNIYHLWYSGANGLGPEYYAQGIGHATSIDGINWTKEAFPVFHSNDGKEWRNARTYTPLVLYDRNGFETGSCPNLKMWFNGKTGSEYTIGYAYGCVPQTSSKKLSPTMFYNVKVVEIFNPTSNIHYIGGGGFTQGAVLTRNVDNIIQIGVQNRGILKAKNVSITVEGSPSCVDIDIKQSKVDIFPKSTYYFDVTINPKCEKGNYKLVFLVQGNNISQIEEFEFSVE
ncbi:MAG: hypothetical protein GKC01_04455 [Candidatus Methanofastidiosa archaeon]|nr:hypothetical protein [Candidatus Methanofastidiosa archaeon]